MKITDLPKPKSKKVWGSTSFKTIKVEISVVDARSMQGHDALTGVVEGVWYVWLHPSVPKRPANLAETLIHELVHVIEGANDIELLSAEEVDNCTTLAQTMGKQLGRMLLNLKVERGFKKPF